MRVFNTIQSFRKYRSQIPLKKHLGFVPTMGALHQGHASLARKSVSENDVTIASIFVNPTQFGPNEDLDAYPRTLEKDVNLLTSLGVDAVFAPPRDQVYSKTHNQILFEIRDLDKSLCGASREGHFNGVVQVVSILFNIVQPQRAYFGLKDFQQLMIIRHLVKEMHFPIEVVGCPIIREEDGLAMSSRNVYLNPDERKQALFLHATLSAIKQKIDSFHTVEEVRNFVNERLAKFPLARLDYFDILNGYDLSPIHTLKKENQPQAFLAAFLGKTRLIDNMSLYD